VFLAGKLDPDFGNSGNPKTKFRTFHDLVKLVPDPNLDFRFWFLLSKIYSQSVVECLSRIAEIPAHNLAGHPIACQAIPYLAGKKKTRRVPGCGYQI
jgi:hypothetical protein